MPDLPVEGSPAPDRSPDDRLASWKEIAAYLKRDVTTVQRWERREGMPVHRHVHEKMGSVYAFRSELDAWTRSRKPAAESTPAAAVEGGEPVRTPAIDGRARRGVRSRPIVAAAAVLALALLGLQLARSRGPVNPLDGARFVPLSESAGNEGAAVLSADGRFVAFLSDRDGRMDVWVTQVGTGQFHNLTRGAAPELVNPSVRTLGFTPDGALVTFWTRRTLDGGGSRIDVWGAPVLGGAPRPYLEGVAEFDWSRDGARLVYHTPGPGDPMFVRGRADEAPQHIASAPDGQHSHFPLWSPDAAHVYFVQGTLPDKMDLWRIPAAGGTPERMTTHDAYVSHPVFLDARTVLYLATDRDGSGPWLHALDLRTRTSHRVSFGVEKYASLAASADGRRLVATIARPKGALWRFPITPAPARPDHGRRLPLTTASATAPRLAADYLVYVSSKPEGDSLYKFGSGNLSELWSEPGARIIGAPAVSRSAARIAFTARRQDGPALYVVDSDGTNARILTSALALDGAPVWAPDGASVTVAALSNGAPQLFTVPLDGRAPSRLVAGHAVDPVWSPAGDLVLYSGPDIGTTFMVKAAAADGRPAPLRPVTLSRGARRLCFMPGSRTLVVLRGDITHKNLWAIDLETGAERQLTDFPAGFTVRDFDISPDGAELVVEQVQNDSDIVLIELPPRR